MANEVLEFFVRLGLLDVILPFVIVFVIVFGLLEKLQMFGTRKKNLHAMLAFVMAFLVVAAVSTVKLLTIIAQYFVLIVLVLFLVLIVAAMFGVKSFGASTMLKWAAGVIIAAIVLSGLSYYGVLDKYVAPGYFMAGIAILVFIGIVMFIVAKGEKKEEKKGMAEEKVNEEKTPAKKRVARTEGDDDGVALHEMVEEHKRGKKVMDTFSRLTPEGHREFQRVQASGASPDEMEEFLEEVRKSGDKRLYG